MAGVRVGAHYGHRFWAIEGMRHSARSRLAAVKPGFGRWTAAGGGGTGGAMANMSEHQREAERAHAALTTGQGIVETPRFKEMVVAGIAKPPRQRSGAERHLIEIAQALWAREHQRLVQEGKAKKGA